MKNNPLSTLSNGQIQVVAEFFRALSEVSRLRILQALNSGEKNVTELSVKTRLSQSNVSRHLSVLTAARVVSKRRDGTNILYVVSDPSLVDACIAACKRFGNGRNHRG